MSEVGIEGIREAVRSLGFSRLPVCIHASLRSFGRVRGGAEAVVRGFLEEDCTVMVPTFSSDIFAVSPPADQRPLRNGSDYGSDGGTLPERTPKRVYSPGKSEIDREMGAVPAAIIAMPERVRGDHPLNSFSASGPLAQDLIAGQSGLDVYAPLRRLRELGGAVVLMGVGLTRMTLLHLAEAQAGRELFVRWANGRDGKPVGVRVGGCSEGFERLAPVLAGLERKLTVGDSLWRVYPARETLERAAAAIRAHPEITRCGDPACVRCSDAVRGGPVLEAPYLKTVDLKTVERTWR